MKRFSKIMSLLLVFVMLSSLCAVSSFAATEETVKQYGLVDENGKSGYLVFGDSFSRGMGANESEYSDFNCRKVTGSYPYTVAQAVGCDAPEKMADKSGNYWPCCYPGQTLAATMDLVGIDDGYYDEEFAHNFYSYSRYDLLMVPYFGCAESVDGNGASGKTGDIRNLISRAGLISVELGMSDVFYRAIHVVERSDLLSDNSIPEAERYAKAAAMLVEKIYEGFDYWRENYPVFIGALQEMNPYADIVVLGVFNPLDGAELTDELLIPVGSAFSAVTGMMNQMYEKWAEELGVIYVDISNVETYSAQYDWSILGDVMANTELATHPTPESYAYIARRIISALPTADGETEPVTKDIKVDLGRYTKVSYVLLDGKAVKDYSMEGYMLTVPCECACAKNLTVAIFNEGGKLDIVSYQLSYDKDAGYSAYRILGKNDVIGAAVKSAKAVITLAVNATKTVLGKLFK